MRTRLLALPAALLAAALLAGCSGDDDGEAASDPNTGSQDDGGVSCSYPESGNPPAKEVEPPPSQAAVSGDVGVTIATGVGDIGATMDADATPCTVNSFVSLAEQGYFDGTSCHRLTTAGILVLQCGDPTGTGSGGPGYTFEDELTGAETYSAGTLAMANAGEDTNGSQFFIVYGATELPPSYTVFGTVDRAGVEVVKAVAEKGDATGTGDGPPKQPVEIESVTVD